MLGDLSTKLQKILRDFKGEGRLSEHHIEVAMREIRIALLEADVHFKVVKEFVSRVKEKALGQEVLRNLMPAQQVVKIVGDELTELFGREEAGLVFSKPSPSVILLIGLQGSGKTTTTGKLALWLKNKGFQPLMVSIDVYRPAAMEQLSVIAREIEIGVYEEKSSDAVELASDAMTGQDAVNSAREFNQRLNLSGVVLTKMDGDAQGGAALSIKTVTGKPIKFIGVGEKYEALEVFHPERMTSRILGMGDVLSLIEKAEAGVDEEHAQEMLKKMQRNEFTLEDFRQQLRQLRRLGPLEQVLGMLPKMGPLKGLNKLQVDEKQLTHLEAIINSMTLKERAAYKSINASRRRRVAKGSGRPVSEVNRLLKQYVQTRKMMNKVSKGFSSKGLPKLNFPI
jgi:signal recognition particle subunit SRP54